jgi:hypothetical protein
MALRSCDRENGLASKPARPICVRTLRISSLYPEMNSTWSEGEAPAGAAPSRARVSLA